MQIVLSLDYHINDQLKLYYITITRTKNVEHISVALKSFRNQIKRNRLILHRSIVLINLTINS